MSEALHTNVTNAIIEALETAGKYDCPWHKMGIGLFANLTTNKPYNGVNILLLAIAKKKHGFTSDKWLGLGQAKAIKRRIKLEEFKKATWIALPIIKDELDENGKPILNAEGKPKTNFYGYKGVEVYNESQLEDYVIEPMHLNNHNSIEAAQILVNPFLIYIDENQSNQAYYNIVTDRINMPLRGQFKKPEGLYKTMFHELTHFTSHKDRLDRDLSTYGEDIKARAFEEIIAELGSAFLCAETGISVETMEYHESYIASWIEALKNDNKMIFKAASQASKAANWIKEGVV